MPLKSRTEDKGGFMMVYGIPGSGKTGLGAAWLAELLERTGKPGVLVDWDRGVVTIPNWINFQYWEPDVSNPIDEMQRVIGLLRSGEVSGLVDDTTSFLSERCILPYVTQQQYTDKKRMGFTTEQGMEVRQPTLPDYGFAETQTAQYLIQLRDVAASMGLGILSLCHSKALEMKTASGVVHDPIVGPSFAGNKLTRSIDQLPNITGRIYVSKVGKDVKYTFIAQGDGLYKGKDRLRVVPPAGFDLTCPITPGQGPEEWEKQWIARMRVLCGAIQERMGIGKANGQKGKE